MSIRKWASAALGAALLTTSIITGAGAANALPLKMPYEVSVVPGAVGGSGKIVIVGAVGYTATYANPNCAPEFYKPRQMVTSTSLVTIGGTLHTSPQMSTWPTAATSRTKTYAMTTGCWSSTGQHLSATGWIETYDMRTWSVDYTCQPAGTKPSIVYMYGLARWGPSASPPAIPDNGPLPASCGAGSGGSDHCGCGSSGTGGTQHGQPGTAPSGSAAHGGGSAIATGATTGVAAAPARAAGTGESTIVPGTAPVAPVAPARTAGRGLAVQTAVAADPTGPDQSALAGWSALTGLLGLAFAADAALRLRRPRLPD